jgi:hypothetical protein
VTAIDLTVSVKTEGGRRIATWWPDFRIIDTASVTPDAELLDRGCGRGSVGGALGHDAPA